METKTEQIAVLHVEMAQKFNFACHQSAHPLLQALRIDNLSDEQLEDVLITLSADPEFLEPKAWRLDRIASQGSISVRDRDIKIKGGYLQNLRDAVRGTATIRAISNGELLAEKSVPVELLAFNEWGGAGYMPEMLAAFCTPNDVVIDRILSEAASVLRQAGKSGSIDGYKSGSRQRVWEIASAIYSAIAKLQLSYALPPASFEQDGQKIRLPGQIRSGGVATCLDLSLLYAAALEQAGLNPLIVVPQGHALVGLWLQPSVLAGIVTDDAQALRKHVQVNELLLIETTLLTASPVLPFRHATEQGEAQLGVESDLTFRAAVDIHLARSHRILPLGLTVKTPDLPNRDPEVSHTPPFDAGPGGLANFDILPDDDVPETPQDRLQRWQKKLLDLTARNPLLNYRESLSNLRLLYPDCGKLEDMLSAGAKFSIESALSPEGKKQDEQLHLQRTGENITAEHARDALERKQLLVGVSAKELEKRTVNIYRKAQTSLQEGGSNTLYLALGFLRWTRDDKADKAFLAPLILLPVALERKSVRSGVKLKAHDDEPHFNQTLLEMLHADYGIRIPALEGSLPTDESGIDVSRIWKLVKHAVLDVPGFEVTEDVVLGHFSFAKYLMWKDLRDRTDALRQNALVRHLLDTPTERFVAEGGFVNERDLDRDFLPRDLLTPLPADASQMAAIASANRGISFVLIGPPGTGKSQTIVNLIAHLLGNDKTVLFVSEKTAALDVVHRRLDSIGLGRFCLPLHSNKANKADVLKKLDEAWQASRSMTREEWHVQADELRQLRDRLNQFVAHLHQERSNGLTAHYAIGIKIRDEALARHAPLSWPRIDQHDARSLAGLRKLVDQLKIQANTVGELRNSAFKLIAHDDWKPEWQRTMARQARELASAAAQLSAASQKLCAALQIPLTGLTFSKLRSLEQLALALRNAHRRQVGFAMEPNANDQFDALEAAAARLQSYAKVQQELSCSYAPLAWRQLDGDDIGRRWQTAKQAWWPKSVFAKRAIIRELRQNGAQGLPDPTNDASTLRSLRQEGQAIDELGEQLSALKIWQAHNTDPQALQSLHELASQLRKAVGALAENLEEIDQLKGKIHAIVGKGNDLLAPDAAIGRTITAYSEALARFEQAKEDFEVACGQAIDEQTLRSARFLDVLQMTAETIAQRQAELSGWCDWRKRRDAACQLGLKPLVTALENGDVKPDDLPEVFEAAYCSWWSERLLDEDPVLRISTAEHTAAIAKFRKLDDQFQKTTGAYIAAKLSGRIPDDSSTTRKSQWGILRHEIQKKRRHKAVRQLVQEIPEVLTTLAPCLMMSPLSVAQYLPADQALFDVVVFDEASQITVWDAIGAIARGRQAIVVGDPKQMPPTNFFDRSVDDLYEPADSMEDLESILDQMRASSVPELMLNLHYRSRSESLIAFSNHRYYGDELVTFPSVKTQDHAITLIRPSGFYSRGKAQTNQGEAQAIVDEIVKRLTSDRTDLRGLSLGVVTFNSKQQTLIEDLLDHARSRNPDIEWAFSAELEEPVFVKNLETVQGDERDVILFSVTYGPDESGHVTMNLGPLNRDGGERRLNVALTRARSEMLVFSTLRPEQIDLSRTRAKAVADLKHFLEYAEHGSSALGQAVCGPRGDFDSPFESAVARALREKGWIVHPQVGVSAYRIDLGIVHPDAPGVYLAGIECDGATYHSSATARERNKIRQSVLEGLGWTIRRVWSTDWWKNKNNAIAQIHADLQKLLRLDRAERARQAQRLAREQAKAQRQARERAQKQAQEQAQKQISNQALVDASPQTPKPPPKLTPKQSRKQARRQARKRAREQARQQELNKKTALAVSLDHETNALQDQSPLATHEQPRDVSRVASAEVADTRGDLDSNRYVLAALEGDEAFKPDPELFYDVQYESRLGAMIDFVVDTEGPIHKSILVDRIARHHGFLRSGSRIKEIVESLAKKRRQYTREGKALFFWPNGKLKGHLAPARYLDRENDLRRLEYICREELRAIDRACNLGQDPKALADKLGIGRFTQRVRVRLENALEEARSEHEVADSSVPSGQVDRPQL